MVGPCGRPSCSNRASLRGETQMELDDAGGHSFGSECFEAEGPSRPARNEGPENPKSMSDAGVCFKQGAVQKIKPSNLHLCVN